MEGKGLDLGIKIVFYNLEEQEELIFKYINASMSWSSSFIFGNDLYSPL